MRPDMFVAHLHGDEFAILAMGVADRSAAKALASEVCGLVEPPITHELANSMSRHARHHLVRDLADFKRPWVPQTAGCSR